MRIRTGLPQVLNLHPARPQPVHRLLLLTNHWQLAVGGTEHGAMETGMLGLIMRDQPTPAELQGSLPNKPKHRNN
jgi:hypothetical protein